MLIFGGKFPLIDFSPSMGVKSCIHRIAQYELAKSGIESKVPDVGKYALKLTYLQRAADAHGEIAIGVQPAAQEGKPDGDVQLNSRRGQCLLLNEDDQVIVLTPLRWAEMPIRLLRS